jgi:hypothetical protein
MDGRLFDYAAIQDGDLESLEIDIGALGDIYDCECQPVTLKPHPALCSRGGAPLITP